MTFKQAENEMPLRPIDFPPVPEDTARAAGSLFGKGNIYLRLGEHIQELLYEMTPVEMEIQGQRSTQANALYALLTAFQFGEELTDHQMFEAVRRRVDLKYALHLPMNYPRFDPGVLCEFRKEILADSSRQQTFQGLLDRLADFGLLKMTQEQPLLAVQVLDKVCVSNRLEMVVEAMFQALETLAATNSEWLRQVTLPHWYERYSRRIQRYFWPNNKGKWEASALEIGRDIQYLLGEIDKSHLSTLNSLREVHLLRQAWEEQFEVTTNDVSHTREVHWRPTWCASCTQDN